MPDVGRSALYQTAVVWDATGAPDVYAQPTLAAPCQVRCRFERTSRQLVRPDGTVVNLDAVMFTTRFLPTYSKVWLGRYADLPAGTDFSASAADLYEVQSCDQI